MTKAMARIKIDANEPVVSDWFAKKGLDIPDGTVIVPKFHVETNLRKWGGIHAEVLSIHCSTADVDYLKYLLSEIGENKILKKGLYIPTGMHLMGSSEIMKEILIEHKRFLDSVTSIQIGGITSNDMLKSTETKTSIQTVLMKAEGVHAIEKLYHTDSSGQWTVIVQKDKVTNFVTHITKHLEVIYKNKGSAKPKLLTYKTQTGEYHRRVVLNDKTIGKVGSYAEALKQRFPTQQPESTITRARTDYRVDGNKPTVGSKTQFPPLGTKTQTTAINRVVAESIKGKVQTTKEKARPDGTGRILPTENNIQRTEFTKRLETMEQSFNEKLQAIEENSTSLITQMEQRVTEKMETLMDSKLAYMSMVVANIVTKKLTVSIKKMMHGKSNPDTLESGMDEVTITQDSPSKEMKKQVMLKSSTEAGINDINCLVTDTVSDIQKNTGQAIERHNKSDSPHDINTTESSVVT